MATDPPRAAEPVDEYEREPVPEHARLGLKSFVGQYAGEHIAGTELMIGPLFIAHGVAAADLLGGLLVGNLLAVLSWVYLCAPIATRARLTLYYQLEKICGRKLVTLYNLANGIMFCCLAGAMVTVSTTAVGVWFHIDMPTLSDWSPHGLGWILTGLIVGMLVSVVAAYGYLAVARFANLAAPWMVLVFVAFGIIGLKQIGMRSPGEFWDLAQTAIWKGGAPLSGNVKFTFWHVTFFAWFCNMAVHIGMADLSVLRYARKSGYGIASAAGMFIGHYMAWLSASILYAVQLKNDPTQTTPLPGPLAASACGVAGLICVIIAGWTTANPTIYRAGLAFQSIVPRASRFKVTLLTGMAATVAGLFPALAMKLLDFVALYGLVLMPMGAVLFVDFWLAKRIGFEPDYAARYQVSFNTAAAVAWFVTLGFCAWLVLSGLTPIFFAGLPGWFVAALLFALLSRFRQRRLPALGHA